MSAGSAPVIASGLCKRFRAPDGRHFQALDNVSMQLHAGELTALVGPDGAGKTTLLRMMAGLLLPDAGQLSVLGVDVVKEAPTVQARISYMPQRFGLYEDLSVQENLDLYADLHAVPAHVRRARFARLLEMTDLAGFTARQAGQLSGGMKQKLGLACTLVRAPELLLLDEPTVGVDPLSRRDLWQIVQQLITEEHLNVIVSTAYMDEAARCTRVCVMHAGQVLADTSPAGLTARVQGLTYAVRPGQGESPRALQARLLDAPGLIIDALPRGDTVCFIRRPDADSSQLEALLGAGIPEARPAGLEDAFMMLLHTRQDAPLTDAAPQSFAPAHPVCGEKKEAVIIVRDLVRRFGTFTAVANTSFEVGRGEIFGLLGPNGAGKTTTFRMLCGLLPPTGGHLEVAGVNLRTARARARRRIGYVAQKFSLYGNLTVRENLEFFGGAYGLYGKALRRRVERSIEQFGLDPGAISGNLPGGYRQRLSMAAGLLHEPEILFLDEPTSGIDPIARRAFWHTITALAQSGVTIIITTHFMEEAEYCDRIAIQDAGKMLALGTPQAIRETIGADSTLDMNEAFIRIVEQSRCLARATPPQGKA